MPNRHPPTHYMVGKWGDGMTPCGIRSAALRPVITTRKVADVTCGTCKRWLRLEAESTPALREALSNRG